MKQRILLAMIAGIFSSVVAAQSPSSTKIIHGPAFERLHISGPVTVELIESEESSVQVEGDLEFINKFSFSWSRNELSVSYFGIANPRNPVIKIFINRLASIHAEEGARVSTPNPLFTSANLRVSVKDEESLARILSYGKIRVADPGHVQMRKVHSAKK